MGPFSGKSGIGGKRVAKPPRFMYERPPSNQDPFNLHHEPSPLPLHIKPVDILSWNGIKSVAAGTTFETDINEAEKWLLPENYSGKDLSIGRRKLFPARFNHDQIFELYSSGRLTPALPSNILSYVNMFGHEERAKNRQRIISEPWVNRVIADTEVGKLKHPSRLEKRSQILDMKCVIQFDMASFYDQFEFSENAKPYFGVKTVPVTLPPLNRLPNSGLYLDCLWEQHSPPSEPNPSHGPCATPSVPNTFAWPQ